MVEDGKAAVKRLKLGDESGTEVVVEDGLSTGAQVIVEGLQNVRPGIAVRASPSRKTTTRRSITATWATSMTSTLTMAN